MGPAFEELAQSVRAVTELVGKGMSFRDQDIAGNCQGIEIRRMREMLAAGR